MINEEKTSRVSKTTENFNLYKDSVATMEIRIKMREEELKKMLKKKMELDMVGPEGSSSTKSEQKKTIINQLRYINITKKFL